MAKNLKTEMAPTPGTTASVGSALPAMAAVDLDPVATVESAYPRLAPSPMFLLAVHPNAWSIRDGVLLPSFKTIKLQHGVDGITDQAVNGRPDPAPASERAAARGWTTIPTRMGPCGKSYLTPYAVNASGQVVHVTCFDQVFAGSDRIRCDRKAMAAWVRELVADGQIPGPSLLGLMDERTRLEGAAMVAGTKAISSVAAQSRLKAIESAIAVLDGEIAKLSEAAKPIAASAAVDLD